MDIKTIGNIVKQRRIAIGLTQEKLAKLSDLSRQSVQQLESGTIHDLSFQRVMTLLSVLGLSLDAPSLQAREKKNGLWMAAKTASVSYKNNLTENALETILATGNALNSYEAHIGHLLDEAPVQIVVMAVEETAQREKQSVSAIWKNIAKLAESYSHDRKALWV